MFVIYCRFSQQHNYIFPLIESIVKFHPDAKIGIWDSFSENDDYLYELQKMYNKERRIIEVHPNNGHYGDSAIWEAFSLYPDEEYFYLLQDSMLVKQNLDFMKENYFYSYMHFDYPEKYDSEQQKEYCKSQIAKTKLKWRDDYFGVFGITFGIKREVLKDLYDAGLSQCLPDNKLEMQGSERIWGIALKNMEIDATRHSICGNYFHPSKEGKNIIEKFFAGRA